MAFLFLLGSDLPEVSEIIEVVDMPLSNPRTVGAPEGLRGVMSGGGASIPTAGSETVATAGCEATMMPMEFDRLLLLYQKSNFRTDCRE